MPGMATQVWVRNPDYYIKECLELGVENIAWDRGYLVKRNIDPDKFIDLYYPSTQRYRMLVIGTTDQGASEITRGYSFARPLRVHQVWEYGDPWDLLEEMAEGATPDQMVVVTRLPNASQGLGRRFYRALADLQEEYPKVRFHLHGLYSWRVMFGLGFRSVDIDPRTSAKKGKVYLPMGREMTYEKAAEQPHWITLLGYAPSDLRVARNRCMFNIKSAQWASRNYRENVKFKYKGAHDFDPDAIKVKPPVNNAIQVHRQPAIVGDKLLCDACSLQNSCKYFRVGSVCSVPDTEGSGLAAMFRSRDSDTIIEGLGTLLEKETNRLERAMSDEDLSDKIDPEVTKIINTLFDRGVKLAKLVDPRLAAAGAARINVRLNQQNNAITAASPQALMAAVVADLEGRGVPRDQITPEMVKAVLTDPDEVKRRAIDVASAES